MRLSRRDCRDRVSLPWLILTGTDAVIALVGDDQLDSLVCMNRELPVVVPNEQASAIPCEELPDPHALGHRRRRYEWPHAVERARSPPRSRFVERPGQENVEHALWILEE